MVTEATQPTWYGEKADKGRIIIQPQYGGEGYAVIRCGNTEVQVGYTLLGQMLLDTKSDFYGRAMGDIQRALYSITCEAGLGRTGDDQSIKALSGTVNLRGRESPDTTSHRHPGVEVASWHSVYMDDGAPEFHMTINSGPMSISHWGMIDLGRFGAVIYPDGAYWQEDGETFEVRRDWVSQV